MRTKPTPYAKKLKDPRWQKLRLEVMERDDWKCCSCGDTECELHVHHGYYEFGQEPWDYPIDSLHTYCHVCHEEANAYRKELIHSLGFIRIESQRALCTLIQSLLMDLGHVEMSLFLEEICDIGVEIGKEKRVPDYKARLSIQIDDA